MHLSTGDPASSHQFTVTFTPRNVYSQIAFYTTRLGNPGGTSDATLAIGSQGTAQGFSPVSANVKASSAGSSIVLRVNPDAGSGQSSLQSIVIVPPQILLQMMHNEAGGVSSTTVRRYLGFALKNRFSDSQYFSGQTTYQAAVNAGATHSDLGTGLQPFLDDAVTVFWDTSGGGDPTYGCQGFWSPTDAQWAILNDALSSRTTTLPDNVGAPSFVSSYPRQYVYFSSVGNGTVPGSRNAPSFVFVRKRPDPNDQAVIKLD